MKNFIAITFAALALNLFAKKNIHAGEHSATDELGIIIVGDQGKGNEGQLKVADAMFSFCKTSRCDFAFLLGDNFYQSGVKSLYDSKFKTHFEDPYSRFGIEFWAILGNHDYGFGLARGNIQAQVDYTRISSSWRMPTRYYSFETHGIEFIAIDTVSLNRDLPQQTWLKSKLDSPRSGFRAVLGHYPIHSGGLHGDTPDLRDRWSPMLCHSADLYISGHDHHLEHLKTDCGVDLMLSGAGAEARSVQPTQRTLFAASALGFSYLFKDRNGQLWARYFDTHLNLLAEFEIKK